MNIFQIGAVLFALFMMYVIRIHKRKAGLKVIEVSFWYSLWALFIILALFPNLLMGVVGVLRFTRVFDLLTVLSFMVLTFLIFTTHLSQKENNQKMEELIRKQALHEVNKDSKKNEK